MLGAPMILGAAAFEARKIFHPAGTEGLAPADILPLVFGLISAALVGYIAIGYLINYLQRRNTLIFLIYRVAFGVIVLAAYAAGYFVGFCVLYVMFFL